MVANVIDNKRFPTLGTDTVAARDLIHGYARVLGDVLKVCRLKRKHWWHASLRPSLHGLSTGVVRSNRDFEIVLDLNTRRCSARTTDGKALEVEFRGLSPIALAEALAEFLSHCGVDKKSIDKLVTAERSGADGESFSGEGTRRIGRVLAAAASSLEQFRSTIKEETSPVQVWPHHFDLSMIWLPGEKISGQDPENEEYSDKQMNFGFGFGDETVNEPYFYVTAYPTPDGMQDISLPDGAEWETDGFSGLVVPYAFVAERSEPNAYLQELWTTLLQTGRNKML